MRSHPVHFSHSLFARSIDCHDLAHNHHHLPRRPRPAMLATLVGSAVVLNAGRPGRPAGRRSPRRGAAVRPSHVVLAGGGVSAVADGPYACAAAVGREAEPAELVPAPAGGGPARHVVAPAALLHPRPARRAAAHTLQRLHQRHLVRRRRVRVVLRAGAALVPHAAVREARPPPAPPGRSNTSPSEPHPGHDPAQEPII